MKEGSNKEGTAITKKEICQGRFQTFAQRGAKLRADCSSSQSIFYTPPPAAGGKPWLVPEGRLRPASLRNHPWLICIKYHTTIPSNIYKTTKNVNFKKTNEIKHDHKGHWKATFMVKPFWHINLRSILMTIYMNANIMTQFFLLMITKIT